LGVEPDQLLYVGTILNRIVEGARAVASARVDNHVMDHEVPYARGILTGCLNLLTTVPRIVHLERSPSAS